MGDQKFDCGRYKNRTFEEIAATDKEFCDVVLKSTVSSKYYPEEFKAYLRGRERLISESNITGFVRKWDEALAAEFRAIIGNPSVTIREVHPKAQVFPNGNIGVFCKYFIKKCIFNIKKENASIYSVETFAKIFPFKVSKTVRLVTPPVLTLFDHEFHSEVDGFIAEHFDGTFEREKTIKLFLSNVYHFRMKYFDHRSLQRLRDVVYAARKGERLSSSRSSYVNEYLKNFPRLNANGVERYKAIRNTYNSLCAAYGRDELDEQSKTSIRLLPEITCYELLSLLEGDLFIDDRKKYLEWFKKYLFFFTYAIEGESENPVFFIDDSLYECLKCYTEFRNVRQAPENWKLFVWMMSLIHRRTQRSSDNSSTARNFDVDDDNLRNIREYVENFPGIESAVVDFIVTTDVVIVGIPIFTRDTILHTFYSSKEKSNVSDFYELLIRAVMCPAQLNRCVIYNAYSGVETSMEVPPVKDEILKFIGKHNHFSPSQIIPVESIFTDDLNEFFEKETIQWETKSSNI